MKKPARYTLDIETFPNYFLAVYKNYETKEFIEFEISEWQNDLKALVQFIHDNKDCYCVAFNSVHFDSPVLNYIVKEYNFLSKKDGFNCAFKIWEMAQYIINDTGNENIPDKEDELDLQLYLFEEDEKITAFDLRKYIGNNFDKYKSYRWNINWINIDLYLYWSKLTRQSKKISLKGLACHMNWEWIQELPLSPISFVTEDIRDQVKLYCRNDVNITEHLLERLKDDVNFRFTLIKEFGNAVLSWDGPKIGMEALARSVAEKSKKDVKEIKGHKTFRKEVNLDEIMIDIEFKDSTYE